MCFWLEIVLFFAYQLREWKYLRLGSDLVKVDLGATNGKYLKKIFRVSYLRHDNACQYILLFHLLVNAILIYLPSVESEITDDVASYVFISVSTVIIDISCVFVFNVYV